MSGRQIPDLGLAAQKRRGWRPLSVWLAIFALALATFFGSWGWGSQAEASTAIIYYVDPSGGISTDWVNTWIYCQTPYTARTWWHDVRTNEWRCAYSNEL